MEKKHPYLMSACRGLCIAVCFTLLSLLITILLQIDALTNHPLLRGLPPFAVNIFCTFMSVLALNSFSLAFSYSDRVRIEEFIEREEQYAEFKNEMKLLVSSRKFWAEISAELSFIALMALIGAFPSVGGMFPHAMPKGGWFPVVILVPLSFILSVWSKYEAARYYEKLHEEHDIEKLLSPFWLVKRVLILIVIYPIAAPIAPLLLFAVISVFSVFAKMSAIFTAVGVIFGIAAIIFAFWAIRVLRGISGRKKFIKKLRYTAEKEGCAIEDIKNPYRSFATSKNHCTFTIVDGENKYDCVMISTLGKKTPLVFTSASDAHFLHRIGTKNHGFDIRHNIKFTHRGEGIKIIIVDPTPKNVLVTENRKEKRLFSADVIWKCTVHDSDSFIGCMERHCIEGRRAYQDD